MVRMLPTLSPLITSDSLEGIESKEENGKESLCGEGRRRGGGGGEHQGFRGEAWRHGGREESTRPRREEQDEPEEEQGKEQEGMSFGSAYLHVVVERFTSLLQSHVQHVINHLI